MTSARFGIFGLVCGLTSACTPIDAVGKPEVDGAIDDAKDPDDASDRADASLDSSRDGARSLADSEDTDAALDRVDTTSGRAPLDGGSKSEASSPDSASRDDAKAAETTPQDGGDAGPAAACTPNDAKCEDLIPMHCESGQWKQEAACPFACNAGECVGVCIPESKQCADDNKTRQTCDKKGNWVDEETCPSVCNKVDGECAGSCEPGKNKCNGTRPLTCDEYGVWQTGEIKERVCEAECTPGHPPDCYKDTHNAALCSDEGKLVPGPLSRACDAECLPEDTGCDLATHEYKTCQADGTLVREVTVACGAACTPGQTACDMDRNADGSNPSPSGIDGAFAAWSQPMNVSTAKCSAAGEWVSQGYCTGTCSYLYMGTTVPAYYCKVSGGMAQCHAGGNCP